MLIKTDPAIIQSYLEDSSNISGGRADEVLIPADAEEISGILAEASAKGVPVTISGGGTGTTGGRIPFGGKAISMERFNKIIDISLNERSATVQAGVSVEDLKALSEKQGLFYTSHPTEKSAFIGGTISTNASGSRSFKYGPTRKYVNRLKMALPSGKIFEIRRGETFLTRGDPGFKLPDGAYINIPLPSYRMPEVKNAAGYFYKDGMDLIDLFIGQEGTLSVILEAEISLAKKPPEIFSAFVFFKNEADSWMFSEDIKNISKDNRPSGIGGDFNVLSIEYFDCNALELVGAKNPNVPKGMKAAIFFEEEAHAGSDNVSADKWLKLISKHNVSIDDTWVAMNEKDALVFTRLRYAIPEAINDILRKEGIQKLATDIAVPDDKFHNMMSFYDTNLKKEGLRHVIFGHIGESHVHVNMLPRSEDEIVRARDLALKFVRHAVSLGGTVSAEHGIGKIKHRYLEEMYGRSGILEMARIKKAIDPAWILGLDNIFPKETVRFI